MCLSKRGSYHRQIGKPNRNPNRRRLPNLEVPSAIRINNVRKLGAILVLILVLLTASYPVIGASGSSKFTTGTIALSADIQVVPSVATDLTSTDTYVYQLMITNITGSAATITILDKAATPRYLLPKTSIAANTTYVIAFPEGQKMKGGITWSTGTASALQASWRAFRI